MLWPFFRTKVCVTKGEEPPTGGIYVANHNEFYESAEDSLAGHGESTENISASRVVFVCRNER